MNFYHFNFSLDIMKGVDIGSTYHSQRAVREFVRSIADVERNQHKELYNAAKFISVMSDGSTDSSVVEQEIVYMRFALQGVVHTYFLGLKPVEKADAEHIHDAICFQATQVGTDWREKLVAVGTDGASVMTGPKSGVVVRLKEDKSYVIGMHCMNHRLELAYKDAVKSNTLNQKVDKFLRGLYAFYHKSPLNRSNLKKCFKELDIKVLMPTRVGGTRWIGHTLTALTNFLGAYRAIKRNLVEVIVVHFS